MVKKRKRSGRKHVRGKRFSKKGIRKTSRDTKDLPKKQIKLIKEIIDSIAGQNASDIVNILYGRENVNEFDIAKKLNITINQARNILYKLAEEGLVIFTRKKDKKNGGWYTYFWTLDTAKSLFVLRNKITKEIDSLEYQLKSRRAKRFYHCLNCDIEMAEENALLHDFICHECGEVFQLKDNKREIVYLEEQIQQLNGNLSLIGKEIEIIEEKAEVVKLRRLKAEEKKKKAERELKRKARARLKEKEMRGKKVEKRKVKKKKKRIKKVKRGRKRKFRKVKRKRTKKVKKKRKGVKIARKFIKRTKKRIKVKRLFRRITKRGKRR